MMNSGSRWFAYAIAFFFAAPIGAQDVTWEYQNTEDVTWTYVSEYEATFYIVRGTNDYVDSPGQNTLCRHIAEGLGVDRPVFHGWDLDKKPDVWPDWIMRGGNLNGYEEGTLPGVRLNRCWGREVTPVAENHAELGMAGELFVNNGGERLTIAVHIVDDRPNLPEPPAGPQPEYEVCINGGGTIIEGEDAVFTFDVRRAPENGKVMFRVSQRNGDDFLVPGEEGTRHNVSIQGSVNVKTVDDNQAEAYGLIMVSVAHYGGRNDDEACGAVMVEVMVLDNDGGNLVEIVSAETGELPAALGLEQNYPNPFSRSTTIRFTLDAARRIRIEVYDMIGRKVDVLASGTYPAGAHAVSWTAGHLAQGQYVYALESDAGRESRIMHIY